MSASSAKLTDAVRSRDPASPLSARNAQQAIARLSRDLAELTGSAVGLLDTKGKQGSFATDSCRALQPALAKILDERRVAQDHDLQVARLEWLRLSTCLDRAALRIGAYQSHAERFIACAVNLLVTDFPWLDCQLHIEEDRGRTDGYAAGGGSFSMLRKLTSCSCRAYIHHRKDPSGSPIPEQLSKNLLLWPSRNPIRKTLDCPGRAASPRGLQAASPGALPQRGSIRPEHLRYLRCGLVLLQRSTGLHEPEGRVRAHGRAARSGPRAPPTVPAAST